MRKKERQDLARVGRGQYLHKAILLLALGCLLLAAVPLAIAQSEDGPPFTLSWLTVDAGGGRSEGDGYALSGTAGQGRG